MTPKVERTPAQQAIVTTVFEVILTVVALAAYVGIVVITGHGLVERLDHQLARENVALAISAYTLSVVLVTVLSYRMLETTIRTIRKRVEDA
jgi:uncharacterized membrane protein (DUF485 family)